MESLQKEHERVEKKGSLKKSIDDVQKTIDLLLNARNAIAAGEYLCTHWTLRRPILRDALDPSSAAATLAKLQDPVKQSFDKVNDDLKEVHSALGKYAKELDKVCSYRFYRLRQAHAHIHSVEI